MKKMIAIGLAAGCCIGLLSGCGSTAKRLEISDPEALVTISSLDAADWAQVAEKSINSLLASGALRRADGKPSVVMVSRVRNRTLIHFDSGILTSKLRQAILTSRQAQFTSAVGSNGTVDKAVRTVRDLRDDAMFSEQTVPANGTVFAPNMSLSGAIVQQISYEGRREESYFFVHLVLTDLTTGLAVWEDNVEILKQGTHPYFQ